MLIESIMQTNVITVHPSESIETALSKIQQHRIRHLPVVEQESLVGIVTDRDLRDACPSSLDPERDTRILTQPVSSIMTKEVITAHPRDFIEEAALTMYENNVGCLPVIRQNKVVGIITTKDILHTLVELMGVNKPSQRIEVVVPDRPGTLADATDILRDFNMNVTSIFMFPGAQENTKQIVFHVETMDVRRVVHRLTEHGLQVVWPTNDPNDWE